MSNLLKDNKDLMNEWNYEKNKEFDINNITSGSSKKVWWICKNGHEWEASVVNRVKGRSCPICKNKKILLGYNDIFSTNPELEKEWDYDKNELLNISPKNISKGFGKKVWWKCPKGHSYDMTPNQKTSTNARCPICQNDRLLVGYNDLETTNPELSREWDYDKNFPLKPTNVINANNKKIWWVCPSGHSYSQTIISRKRGRGCPKCAYGTHTSFPEQAIYYYLKNVYPDLINNDRHLTIELDLYIPSLNIAVEYDGYYAHSKKNEKDLRKNKICFDNGIKLYRIREDKLKKLNDYSIDIYCKQNDTISLEKAIKQLANLLKIDIDVDINRDSIKIKELYDNYIKAKNILSVKPELASEWNYDKNNNIKPEHVYANSSQKYWWICKNGHEWLASPNKRVSSNRNCPYCTHQKVEVGVNDLETMYPELAKEWHPIKNGKILPNSINAKTNKKYWWIGKCGHEWDSAVSSRIKGIGCPICCNQRIQKGINDLSTTNPELLKEWDYKKNKVLPENISIGSGLKVWWKCDKCGTSWQTSPCVRKKSGCPKCSKKIISDKLSKKILQFSKDGILINEYDSLKKASEETGIEKSNICSVCKGKTKTAGGFVWKYLD